MIHAATTPPTEEHIRSILDRVGLVHLIGHREIRIALLVRTQRAFRGSQTWIVFADEGDGRSRYGIVEWMQTPESGMTWWGECSLCDYTMPTKAAEIMYRQLAGVADYSNILPPNSEVSNAVP